MYCLMQINRRRRGKKRVSDPLPLPLPLFAGEEINMSDPNIRTHRRLARLRFGGGLKIDRIRQRRLLCAKQICSANRYMIFKLS